MTDSERKPVGFSGRELQQIVRAGQFLAACPEFPEADTDWKLKKAQEFMALVGLSPDGQDESVHADMVNSIVDIAEQAVANRDH